MPRYATVEAPSALGHDRLDLRELTLVGQDWGGLIGLRLAAEHPERFARIVAANTGLPSGDQPMPEVWVPTSPDDPASAANRAAWQRLAAWDKPFLVAFSDRDPITGAMAPVLQRTVPGAAGVDHPMITGAGHFLQEDAGERLGTVIADFIRPHPARR
jgi:haloalkane dehalogenase